MKRVSTCPVSFGLLAVLLLGAPAAVADPQNPAVRLAVNGANPSLFAGDAGGSVVQDESQAAFPFPVVPEEQDGPSGGVRFSPQRETLDPLSAQHPEARTPESRNLEYNWTASGRDTGLNYDFAIAPRAGMALGPEGGKVQSAGAEVRFGQRLERLVKQRQTASWDAPAWYLFAAKDGKALTWTPELQAQGAQDGLQYQKERVLVGDAQVGVSVEANGLQASLSFTNRDVRSGPYKREENFLGASLTLKR